MSDHDHVKRLNVITFGHIKSENMKSLKNDNFNRILITLTGYFYWYSNLSDSGLEQADHNN